MAQFVGKWELFNSENFEKFMEATGVSPENIKKAAQALTASAKLTQEISNSGGEWKIKVITNAGEKADIFKPGEEISTATLDGRPVKAKLYLEGDKLITNYKGDNFEMSHVRTTSGNEMTMVMTGNGVSCTRKYKKIN